MDTLGRVEIFLEVAKQQSFAGAAKQLGLTGPAVSKQIMALEADLGVKLLHRTTRLVTLTDEGQLYYDRASHAIEELKEAAEQIHDMKVTPKGDLRVSAPLSFGHMHLIPVLTGFAKKYPDVVLDISLDDRKVDVMADGFDIVFRIGVPEDSSLMVRMLMDCPIGWVASPAYIKAHGMPGTPKDLQNHRIIAYSNLGGTVDWHYKDTNGKTGSVRMDAVFKANTAEMMIEAVLEGIGIAILPEFLVTSLLESKKLIRVMPNYETHPARKVMALMPPSRYRSAKVQLLLDWLAQSCKDAPHSLRRKTK